MAARSYQFGQVYEMSIKLMSAIFETEMFDLPYQKDGQDRNSKASTAKLVLLALADHANDYGESVYPGYDSLEIKTALSRQGISDTLEALKQNGLIEVDVRASRLGTNDYKINIRAFPTLSELVKDLPEVVKPLDSQESSHLTKGSQATRPESSVNHQIKHHKDTPEKKPDILDGELYFALSPKAIAKRDMVARIEKTLNVTVLDPDDNKWKPLIAHCIEKDAEGQTIEKYGEWMTDEKNKYDAPKVSQIAMRPKIIIETWPSAFKAATPAKTTFERKVHPAPRMVD